MVHLLNTARNLLERNAGRYVGAGLHGWSRQEYKGIDSLLVVELQITIATVQSVSPSAGSVGGHHTGCLGEERANNHVFINFRIFIPGYVASDEYADREAVICLSTQIR